MCRKETKAARKGLEDHHHIPIIPYERSIRRSPSISIVFEVLSQRSTEAGWVSRSTNTQRRMQLSFSLSHFHPPPTRLLLLFSRFFRGQGTRTRGKRAMFSSSSHFSCTRNLGGCRCFHLKAVRVRMGLKPSKAVYLYNYYYWYGTYATTLLSVSTTQCTYCTSC